jgi:hypothetical protein
MNDHLKVETAKEWDYFKSHSRSYKLIFATIMAVFSAILQSAGGLLPGIGFLISPFAFLPILITVVYITQFGLPTYFITIFLLLIIQPSELFIFPFTTGVLGVALGLGLKVFRRLIAVAFAGALALMVGICIPLYVLGFPIMGPLLPSVPTLKATIFIFAFSCIYSLLCLLTSLIFLKRINRLVQIKDG